MITPWQGCCCLKNNKRWYYLLVIVIIYWYFYEYTFDSINVGLQVFRQLLRQFDSWLAMQIWQLTICRFELFYIICNIHLNPEWPHRQGCCLACCSCTFESRWGLHWFILCKWHSGGTAHEGGGCDQSIGSTVSDVIVRSWLWLTATRSSSLGCFSTLLQVVDNWPHILW